MFSGNLVFRTASLFSAQNDLQKIAYFGKNHLTSPYQPAIVRYMDTLVTKAAKPIAHTQAAHGQANPKAQKPLTVRRGTPNSTKPLTSTEMTTCFTVPWRIPRSTRALVLAGEGVGYGLV